jgi:hypothetical protein
MFIPMWALWAIGIPCAIALAFSSIMGVLWGWIEFEEWLWKRKRRNRPNEDWWY